MEDLTSNSESRHLLRQFGELSIIGKGAVSLICLLLILLVYVGYNEVKPQEWLHEEIIDLSDGDKLRVTFPRPFHFTSNENELEIVLSLIPNLKIAGNRSYTASLENPDRVLLLDLNGEGYTFRRTLSASKSTAVLRVRPSVSILELPIVPKLQLRIISADDNEKIDPVNHNWKVHILSPTIFYDASVWIVEKAGALALIATVLLWWTDDTRRRQEVQASLRQSIEGIKSLRFEKLEDFKQLQQLLFDVTDKIRKNPEYSELIEQEVQDACRSLVEQNDHWAGMIRTMSDKFFEDPSSQASTIRDILVNLERFYTEIFVDEARSHYFSTIHFGLFQQVEDAELENVFAKLLDCWRERMYDNSRALIVEAVVRKTLDGAGYPPSLALGILMRKLEGNELRDLLRYPRFNNLFPHSNELESYANKRLDEKSASYLSKLLADWLDIVGLQTSPFAHEGDYQNDDLLYKTWLPPIGWDKLETPGNSIVQFETSEDTDLCAYYLVYFLRQRKLSLPLPTFPINLTYGAATESGDIADAILHTYTTDWFDFLSENREAFEKISETDQRMLTELFIWSAGSYLALHSWMLSRAKMIYALDENYFVPVLHRIQKIADETQNLNDRPGLPKRLSWLAVRPPGYEQSYLVGATHQDYTNLQYENLLYLTPFLNEYHIYLKLFVPGSSVSGADPGGSTAVTRSKPMYWSTDSLRQVLDDRVLKASGNRFPFLALLGTMDDPEGRLAQAANGSLTRLLRLGHRLIERHIQQPEVTKYISEATFEATLRE